MEKPVKCYAVDVLKEPENMCIFPACHCGLVDLGTIEMTEEEEQATMWCEIIHAISEADKAGTPSYEFIPRFLEMNYKIERK